MILFFGTRPGKKETKVLNHASCSHCGQMGTLTAVAQPNYAHLFWIPLFTINNIRYAECSHCKKVYYKEEFTPEMERALSQ
ncbi:MAG TPA: zinc-ribbon domain-containing protein [Muricauda sp.]|uniref:Zinc-ribbon domain-containing protein n=1 Tax=Flagellimonas aurea TaxID=2915619 RepID=A0ABS3G638_9FLAO|nr:zinc-ribbon domain-containing protein [Allomuricauda aurea]MAO15594.1 zinc-ribbon domain-containing protein [Allomuricauda sp.]MBO0354519.1 zinc-ribbon domain-containing protein [Allomuricauda aurea]UBZ12724.1 zinc ribbon domain-containing protein [Allomuricauda aquimarina]HBU79019.1 zinc-ribbon domain-containing protein [Allomuricauda sp.]|tara:strand:+ start:2029 stop:2271 length:243 start_codon:yes stop_codon:yes gene_type:complete